MNNLNEKYVESGGSKCPFCDGDDLTQGETNVYPDNCTVEFECSDCKRSWIKTFALSGYEERD